MDTLLSRVTQQAMNYAIRSGITITSGFAIQQCARLLKNKEGQEKEELVTLQHRLEGKIRIISPAIDMIELITARGNTSLESAVSLTKAIRWEIQSLGTRLSKAASNEELSRKGSSKVQSEAGREAELKSIVRDIKALLTRIEDAVPLINLAITTSGVSLSTNLPASISPSRLLQASTFLSAGDSRYNANASHISQIGPNFVLSAYMLFEGHANRPQQDESFRNTTWQEVIHKACLKLIRVPLDRVYEFPYSEDNSRKQRIPNRVGSVSSEDQIRAENKRNEFAYQLVIIEDLEDGRVHTFEDGDEEPTAVDDVAVAGIREVLPVHEVSKIFYADTGKILNIGSDGETNNPVLLLKRDMNASLPRQMMDQRQSETPWYEEEEQGNEEPVAEPSSEPNISSRSTQPRPGATNNNDEGHHKSPWAFPAGLDPEWIAFEVYLEDPGSDSDLEGTSEEHERAYSDSRRSSRVLDPDLTSAMSHLGLTSSANPTQNCAQSQSAGAAEGSHLDSSSNSAKSSLPFNGIGRIQTSLSLLEMLIRLASLQQFQQCSHLAITDELLNFFLEESSTTGAAPGDSQERKRIRISARDRIGFDPYNESPVKRRGEAYQHDTAGIELSEADAGEMSSVGTPGSMRSPLLLRSSGHSSRSQFNTPRKTYSKRLSNPHTGISPFPEPQPLASGLATPPVSAKPRQASYPPEGRSSSLAREFPSSP